MSLFMCFSCSCGHRECSLAPMTGNPGATNSQEPFICNGHQSCCPFARNHNPTMEPRNSQFDGYHNPLGQPYRLPRSADTGRSDSGTWAPVHFPGCPYSHLREPAAGSEHSPANGHIPGSLAASSQHDHIDYGPISMFFFPGRGWKGLYSWEWSYQSSPNVDQQAGASNSSTVGTNANGAGSNTRTRSSGNQPGSTSGGRGGQGH